MLWGWGARFVRGDAYREDFTWLCVSGMWERTGRIGVIQKVGFVRKDERRRLPGFRSGFPCVTSHMRLGRCRRSDVP